MLVISVIALYALQAGSGVFDLILPVATLLLAIGVWWLVSPDVTDADWRTLLLITLVAAVIPLFRIIGGARVDQAIITLPVLGLVAAGTVTTASLVPATDTVARKRLAITFIVLIVGLLVVLKMPVLHSAVTRAISLTGSPDWGWLGFSYVAFRLMHLLLDYRSGRLKPVALSDMLLYVIFFPAISAGPIDRIDHFSRELSAARSLDSACSTVPIAANAAAPARVSSLPEVTASIARWAVLCARA